MLSSEQKQFYKDNGYVTVSDVFTESELEEISKEYNNIFQLKSTSNLEATWDGSWKNDYTEDVDKTFTVQSIHNLQHFSSVFTGVLLHKRLLDAVEDVMGTSNILLHHTKAHIKPPNTGAPFPMHQDYHYFPYKNHSVVAVFIHLDDTTPENGGLAVYPGSHKLGPQSDKSDIETHHYVDQNEFPIEKASPLVAKKGDVVIFSYFLIHGSYVNTSERTRRMFLIQLVSADDVPTKNVHKSPGQGIVLRGRNTNRDSDIKKRNFE